eukprot:CAMPEP_0198251264 /NCGR_PEP_ID=MMETSP1447-20131203/2149_1 /TAXON_ID=420782 /ORGANISM="Chaetoceros dichaeta, Strain CCMP1751" /LENGTH=173 /DNA_ID=CAMNT_0043936241 /DNA_START=56 /DNA_END=577 /DNA_ORIENTATION=-
MADNQENDIVVFVNAAADYRREVPYQIIKISTLVSDAVKDNDDTDDDDDDGPTKHTIPLQDSVTSEVLEKVIEFCTYHQTTPMTAIAAFPEKDEIEIKDLVQDWYSDFASGMEREILFQLLICANYMNIQPLLDLSCLAVAKSIHRKSEDEMREIFHIKKPEPVEAKEESDKL